MGTGFFVTFRVFPGSANTALYVIRSLPADNRDGILLSGGFAGPYISQSMVTGSTKGYELNPAGLLLSYGDDENRDGHPALPLRLEQAVAAWQLISPANREDT